MTLSLHLSRQAKRAVVLFSLLSLMAGSVWAQTQIFVSGTQIFNTKVYDGTTDCGVYYVGQCTGISIAHNVLVTAEARYLDRHVGTAKPVEVTYTVFGDDAFHYIAPAPDTLYADITPRPLTIAGCRISDKVYDGTAAATVANFGTLVGVPAVDSGCVFPTVAAAFQSSAAGVRCPVNVNYGLVCAGGTARVSDFVAPATDTLYAAVAPRMIYVSNVRTATSKTYDGTTHCDILSMGQASGILPSDTVSYTCEANFLTPSAAMLKPVIVTIVAQGPQNRNYTFSDTTLHTGSIAPLRLQCSEPEVQLTKEYDTTDVAFVINPSAPLNVVAGDNVTLLTYAHYDSPDVADNKTITATFALSGAHAANYMAPADMVVSTEGSIILPTQLCQLEGGDLMAATATGFCQSTAAGLLYHIQQGRPTHYRLYFSSAAQSQGFVNTDWIELNPTDSLISIPVPSDCAEGDYEVYVVFVNAAHVSTVPVPATIHVNIPSAFLVQVFDDVVSLDNTTERFLDGYSQWYHNGEPIEHNTKLYQQELGGLTGEYSVRVNVGTATEGFVCPKTFTSATKVSLIHVYPNPVLDRTHVRLQGFAEGEHQLQLFNSFGVMVFSTSFSGTDYQLDLSAMPQGSYMVHIDGRTAKTLKL